MRERINHNGEKHGRLTIVKDIDDGIRPCGQKYRRVECKCDCGNIIQCDLAEVLKGGISSCKCYRHDYFTKHGCNMKNHPYKRVYNIYMNIKKRCYNKNSKAYRLYGERGICMCDKWLEDFNSFLEWSLNNGYNDKLTIDRIDFNGIYEPSNCRWTTTKVQANNKRTNKRINIFGETKNLIEWCNFLHISFQTYKMRRRLGWSEVDSLIKPLKYGENKEVHRSIVEKLRSEYARRKNL